MTDHLFIQQGMPALLDFFCIVLYFVLDTPTILQQKQLPAKDGKTVKEF